MRLKIATKIKKRIAEESNKWIYKWLKKN
jgi:hypothetical protein